MSSGAAEVILESEEGFEDVGVISRDIVALSPRQLFWRRFRADRVAVASAIFIILLILMAIFAPLVVKILGLPGPYVQNPNALDVFGSPTGPSAAHPMGVDQLGRDIMSRVIYGSRVSLEVGIISTIIAAAIGTVLGVFAGFYRGWADTVDLALHRRDARRIRSWCSDWGSVPPARCAAV